MTEETTIQKYQEVIGYDSTEDKRIGFTFTASASKLTIYYFKIKENQLRFQGGGIDCTNHNQKDFISVRMVDKDGIYYPPYTVLRDYINKVPFKKDGTREIKSMSFSQPMPKDIYIEFKYYSFGNTDVLVTGQLFIHRTENEE